MWSIVSFVFIFFFNDTATTEIYTLSLHDALPIYRRWPGKQELVLDAVRSRAPGRSEEHTSELQSHSDLVCRLLLEKKKNQFMNARNKQHKIRARAGAAAREKR